MWKRVLSCEGCFPLVRFSSLYLPSVYCILALTFFLALPERVSIKVASSPVQETNCYGCCVCLFHGTVVHCAFWRKSDPFAFRDQFLCAFLFRTNTWKCFADVRKNCFCSWKVLLPLVWKGVETLFREVNKWITSGNKFVKGKFRVKSDQIYVCRIRNGCCPADSKLNVPEWFLSGCVLPVLCLLRIGFSKHLWFTPQTFLLKHEMVYFSTRFQRNWRLLLFLHRKNCWNLLQVVFHFWQKYLWKPGFLVTFRNIFRP